MTELLTRLMATAVKQPSTTMREPVINMTVAKAATTLPPVILLIHPSAINQRLKNIIRKLVKTDTLMPAFSTRCNQKTVFIKPKEYKDIYFPEISIGSIPSVPFTNQLSIKIIKT